MTTMEYGTEILSARESMLEARGNRYRAERDAARLGREAAEAVYVQAVRDRDSWKYTALGLAIVAVASLVAVLVIVRFNW